MNYFVRYLLLSLLLFMFSACSGGPKLFWTVDEERAGSVASPAGVATADVEPDQAPPVSDYKPAERELPIPRGIGAEGDKLPEKYRKLLAGNAFALVERTYGQSVADLFSASIDAMTSLNVAIESVDSSNGVITSDWVREGENNPNRQATTGLKGGVVLTRHYYILHTYTVQTESGASQAKLELRVLGQAFEGGQWVSRALRRDVSEELFTAVEEQLARVGR